MAHRLDGFTQEAIGGVAIPAIGQHEGDQPTVLVDRAEQVLPLDLSQILISGVSMPEWPAMLMRRAA